MSIMSLKEPVAVAKEARPAEREPDAVSIAASVEPSVSRQSPEAPVNLFCTRVEFFEAYVRDALRS